MVSDSGTGICRNRNRITGTGTGHEISEKSRKFYPPVALLFVLCFLLSADADAERNRCNVIHLGSSLPRGASCTSWLSPYGLFAFGFYPRRDDFTIGIWAMAD
ncbi:hypothetical protein CJ030_MR6G029221 [Morella rubra]|uniref:Uncharacterized protein n=1 Tax=Morella rubra TaxID=262757 RepID=A0A6A1VCS9_9ROSI|nr:hypothetical protein CJ030_MR6G029221 [Morella rubra]